jgi:hypothetical protein
VFLSVTSWLAINWSMVFSCTEGNTIHSFRISDFGTFEQSVGFRLENAADLSGSKYSLIEFTLI